MSQRQDAAARTSPRLVGSGSPGKNPKPLEQTKGEEAQGACGLHVCVHEAGTRRAGEHRVRASTQGLGFAGTH